MRTIPLTDIIIPDDRQRREFPEDKLIELAASIRSKGLFHPIVLRDDGRTLVAGENRIRAVRDFIWALGRKFFYDGMEVPEGHIPFITLNELDPIALEEAELEENTRRNNLTWQEEADAIARLHNLRTRQAEARGEVHRTADTAIELTGRGDGDYSNSVRQALIVAKHLDNPVVANAKSAKEAFKLLKKQEEAARHVALAEAVGQTFSAADHEAYHVDCVDWMAGYLHQGGKGFDVILTDPPYGMGAHEFGDAAGRLSGTEHHYDDSYEAWQRLMRQWCPLSFAIAAPQAHAYVFCDIDRFHELKSFMEMSGWYVFRTPLINVKTNSGRVPLPEHGPRRQYEICLYAIKGDKPVTAIYSDVITSEADEQMGHGAQKPVSLYVDLLKRSVRPGDRVLDTFAGSGPIFPACHQMKVYATGLEKTSESYGKCLERLKGLA